MKTRVKRPTVASHQLKIKVHRLEAQEGVDTLTDFLRVVETTPEERLKADWALMRGDADAHPSEDVRRDARENPESEEGQQVLFRHLIRCAWCRTSMRLGLELSGAAADHPLFELLDEAQEWATRKEVALEAQEAARQELHAAGAALIFLQDGKLFAEAANGEVHEIEGSREEVTRR